MRCFTCANCSWNSLTSSNNPSSLILDVLSGQSLTCRFRILQYWFSGSPSLAHRFVNFAFSLTQYSTRQVCHFPKYCRCQFQDLGQFRTWHFEVSGVQICRGLRQIKNYDPRAGPSSVRPVGYPRRKCQMYMLINQSEFRLCVEVGDHGAPFASVKCLHTALCHTHFRHLAHVASPTLSSSSSASFSIHLALQH